MSFPLCIFRLYWPRAVPFSSPAIFSRKFRRLEHIFLCFIQLCNPADVRHYVVVKLSGLVDGLGEKIERGVQGPSKGGNVHTDATEWGTSSGDAQVDLSIHRHGPCSPL